MERDSYIDGIRSAWLGELFGQAFFSALAQQTADEPMRSAWQTLAQLEQVTGNKMAALLQAHGEATRVDDDIHVSDEVLRHYTDVQPMAAMTRLHEVVTKAIVRFDQLLAVAPEEDVTAVQFLVQHEQALLTFTERQLDGDSTHALQDVETLLAQEENL